MCLATVESKDAVEASVLRNLRRSLSSSTEQGTAAAAAATAASNVDLVRAGVFVAPRNNQRQLQSEEEQDRELKMEELIECNEIGEECLELLKLKPEELFIGIQPGFCACITFDCVDNWLNKRIQCGLFDELSSTRSVPDSESKTDPDPQLSDILV